MTAAHPQTGMRCDIWEKMSNQPRFESRVERFADAAEGSLPCHTCQTAMSYGVAPFCDPGREVQRLGR